MEFVNIKGKRIFEKIVDQIESAIISGTLKTGESLPPENELAHAFGVSRAALREALRILEISGFVVVKKGNRGGTFVQDVASNRKMVEYFSGHVRVGNIDLQQLTEARYWIESIIMDMVARKVTKRDLDVLEKSIEQSEQLYRSGQEKEKIYENFNFHSLLANITGNRIIADMHSAIVNLMSYMMVKIKPSPTMTEKTFKTHRELVALLAQGQWEKAKEINGAHIMQLSPTDPEFRRRLPNDLAHSVTSNRREAQVKRRNQRQMK